MDRTLIVVDDYYDDPDAIRAKALGLKFHRTGRFPGVNSDNHEIERALERVVHAIRTPIQVPARQRDIALFRLTKGSDEGSADVHVDPSPWAGVVYLNPDPPTDGGTSFFRHRTTGLTGWPTTKQVTELVESGRLTEEDTAGRNELERFFGDQGKNRDLWDESLYVPNRYNRAIFYRATQFHTIRTWRGFGDSREKARLTQLFFFGSGSVENPVQPPPG